MAVRTAIVLIAAFLASVSEAQQEFKPLNLTLRNWTEPGRTSEDGVSTSTSTSATFLTAKDELIDGLCRLTTTDQYMNKKVLQMLQEDKVTLIEYQLSFPDYPVNPLTVNMAGVYNAKHWSRLTTAHGQTLLSLAFNYGVLSMMMLTLGTETLHVELRDSPPGCMADASDQIKIDSVRRLLMSDFKVDGITTVDGDRVCYETIVDEGGYAKFRHNCCYKNSMTGSIECTTEIGNIWLSLLYDMLIIVRLGLIFLGPYLFVSAVLNMSKDSVPYVVRLKYKLEKTVCFYQGNALPVNADKILNLSSKKGFPKLQECLKESKVKLKQPIKVRFSQYDINVDYKRLQEENVVPVGLFHSLFSAIFRCQVKFLASFRDCCIAEIFPCSVESMLTWGKFCKKLAKILLILLVPTPFYLRLVVFYEFEYDELQQRKKAIEVGGLKEPLESSLIYYFTPAHGVFICMYILYVFTAIVLAFISQKYRDLGVKNIIVNSFRDLKSLDFTDTLSMIALNTVWPLKRFGALGFCVGIIYWPLAITGSLIVGAVYTLPTLYLTFRMAHHSKSEAVIMSRQNNDFGYKVRVKPDKGMHEFRTDFLLKFVKRKEADGEFDIPLDDLDHIVPGEHIQEDVASIKSTLNRYLRITKYVFCAILSILTLYSVVVIMSEVIGCLVEIVVFTIMGCIVSAGALLKYTLLILLILSYCSNCFSNMEKKYLKMNQALFNEVKSRVKKELVMVASFPSSLRENCAIKAQELNEQADYEAPDDVVQTPANHWMINDLVLFVDSKDTPRIPVQLFHEVIQIPTAGAPGPIYRGYIEVFQQLFKILLFVLFVFIIILSFSSVYKISETNQTLATLVGGFLPRILGIFTLPPSPDVQLETVHFSCHIDETTSNFWQYWPIYDLPFHVVDDEDSDQNSEAKSEEASLAVEDGVSIDLDEIVDIAICLPKWPE